MACRILNIRSASDADALSFFQRLAERGNPADNSGQDVEKQVRAMINYIRTRTYRNILERTRQFDAPERELPRAVSQ